MNGLYNSGGHRKYLTIDERQRFLLAAKTQRPEVYTFCATLAFTGARISEILELEDSQFDFFERSVVIKTLKKRRQGVHRAVPLPKHLLEQLDAVHELRRKQTDSGESERLWPWCRTTAWKRVKEVMRQAHIDGPHASPKGLRHSFGVVAIQKGIPITMVRRWLGHSRLETTSIYADAVGDEERAIAVRFWTSFES